MKWACQRHLKDLKRDDVYFDEQAANRIINFYKLTPHVKGEWAGRPIELENWQKFIVGSLFGWKKAKDDTRKYREAYIEVSRKNGKTTTLAPIGLYGMKFDDEPGAEIYSAATQRDQAKEVFDPAKQMVRKSDYINDIEIYKNNLSHVESFSKFEPLSADYDSLDGKNVHIGLIDELHAHKDSGMYDVIADGTGSRRQPLIIAITTAGYNEESFCKELRDYCEDILNPKSDTVNDSQFAYIAEMDKEDIETKAFWDNEELWVKANPNYGVSVKKDNLRQRIQKAQNMPSERNKILCKRLNIWTNAETRFIDMVKWDKSSEDIQFTNYEEILDRIDGVMGYGGLDLSSKIDITSFVLVFAYEGDFYVLPWFWIPEDNMRERVKKDGVNYDIWAEKGLIRTPPGNVVDYNFIKRDILQLREVLTFEEIAYDPWNATQVSIDLDNEGFTMIETRQGYSSMSPPTKELEKLYFAKELKHGGHPVLRWMADNLVTVNDSNDNMRPDKNKSKEKIDGMVALIMALDRAIRNEAQEESVGDDGIFVL